MDTETVAPDLKHSIAPDLKHAIPGPERPQNSVHRDQTPEPERDECLRVHHHLTSLDLLPDPLILLVVHVAIAVSVATSALASGST
jgi:hypothetical protein